LFTWKDSEPYSPQLEAISQSQVPLIHSTCQQWETLSSPTNTLLEQGGQQITQLFLSLMHCLLPEQPPDKSTHHHPTRKTQRQLQRAYTKLGQIHQTLDSLKGQEPTTSPIWQDQLTLLGTTKQHIHRLHQEDARIAQDHVKQRDNDLYHAHRKQIHNRIYRAQVGEITVDPLESLIDL
jgi:hypothetical protein